MLPAYVLAADLGGYVSILKLVPIILLVLVWARLLTWVDKDAEAAHLPRELLNMIIFVGGLVAFGAFLFLPNFFIALAGYVVILGASFGVYLSLRQRKVGLADLRTEFNDFAKNMVKREKKLKVVAGQVVLSTKQGQVLAPPEGDDPDRDGYSTVQELLTDPLKKNAERIEVRPSNGAAAVQFVVDGVAYNANSLEPAAGAAGISYLKKHAGMDVEDRRKPQTGALRATLSGKRHELEIATAGTTAGESLRITVDPKKRHDHKLDTIGLLPEQMAVLQEVMPDNQGIVLVTAPRGQGLTTMLYSILRGHDAFVYHIQTIERNPAEDLEGITQTRLPPNASATEEFKQIEWVCSQQPDIIMVDELVNPASAQELCRFAKDKRTYIGMRVGSTFDAITTWRRLVGDDAMAAASLRLVVAGRVMRRLCMACKLGYVPDPETVRKLSMDPQKVSKLFQARTQPLHDNRGHPIPCEFCQDLHYKGRFGVFEVFALDDEARQAVAAGGTVNQLKTIFRKQRARYLQEIALSQVEAGETSVQEVLRVLRSAPEQAAGSSAATVARASASAPRAAAKVPPRPKQL